MANVWRRNYTQKFELTSLESQSFKSQVTWKFKTLISVFPTHWNCCKLQPIAFHSASAPCIQIIGKFLSKLKTNVEFTSVCFFLSLGRSSLKSQLPWLLTLEFSKYSLKGVCFSSYSDSVIVPLRHYGRRYCILAGGRSLRSCISFYPQQVCEMILTWNWVLGSLGSLPWHEPSKINRSS